MEYRVEWSTKALGDLLDCVSFLKNVSPESAEEVASKIIEASASLKVFPERHEEFLMPKSFPETIRKHVVNSRYIILYGVSDSRVMIYRVLDDRKRFTGLL